jgi:UDP-N-acetylmuramoyl-tripeptide--D-alanyl-D-alanine ligase
MPSFAPDFLAAATGGTWSEVPAKPILGFSVDSRSLPAGFAFVALKTPKRDGHDFLAVALAAGARAALVARADPKVDLPQLVVPDPLRALQAIAREHRRRFKGPVFGITGSAGKTSTKEILALLLGGEEAGVLATEGNLNNHIGVALTLTRLDPAVHRYAVVEAGISAPGEMAVLAAMIEPNTVIVTFIGPAHLEELGGLEGVAREKVALAAALRPGGTAIFPSSCVVFEAFRELPPDQCLVLELVERLGGANPAASRLAFAVAHAGDATTVSVALGAQPAVVPLRRTTAGMAQNVALAVSAALRYGVRWEEVQRRLAAWHPAHLRGEWTVADGRRVYLDCYNANPASMTDALDAFQATAPVEEPRLYVLGCMEELGREAEGYHLELGRSLRLRRTDRVYAIGSLAEAIRTGLLEAGNDPRQVETAQVVDTLVPRLAAFRGAIFVKGSRRHQLEKGFPAAEHAGAVHA